MSSCVCYGAVRGLGAGGGWVEDGVVGPGCLLFSTTLLTVARTITLAPIEGRARVPTTGGRIGGTALSITSGSTPTCAVINGSSAYRVFICSPTPGRKLRLTCLASSRE